MPETEPVRSNTSGRCVRERFKEKKHTPTISVFSSAAAMLAMSTLMMPAATVTTMTNPAPIAIAQPSKFEPKYILSHNPPPPPLTATAVVPTQVSVNKSGKLFFNFFFSHYRYAVHRLDVSVRVISDPVSKPHGRTIRVSCFVAIFSPSHYGTGYVAP